MALTSTAASGTSPESVQRFLRLEHYSFGVGDRFAHQAKAQLRAFTLAAEEGLEICPVWNKSNREHIIVGSKPDSVRAAAEIAVRELGWKKQFHVDADHINLETVDRFLPSSDYYTLDVAAAIGKPAADDRVSTFIGRHPELFEKINLDGRPETLTMSRDEATRTAKKYLVAVEEAGGIYRHIAGAKQPGSFITEVSMDETDSPQTPGELLVILVMLADQGIPLQTVAPKFSGRFNKGVDYVGNLAQFETEFRSDLAVIAHVVKTYGLPAELKLSVHSGSDKFSIFPVIYRALREIGAGVHVKTAGTTWLEELIGLAEAGGNGLHLAQEIYAEAYAHREELCAPYAAVIDVDPAKLPSPDQIRSWTPKQYVNALRHDQKCPEFNPSLRQLLHVGYKVAAKMGRRYLDMVEAYEESISRNVTTNLYDRHIKPIFVGKQAS